MNVMMVHAKVKPEFVDDVEEAAQKMFAAIDAVQLKGIKYAAGRLPDGVTFVALLALDDATENPLAAMPEFREFQEHLVDWRAEAPVVEPVTIVGSYNLF
jgi:hypothetical protein